jgi:Winged helix-turn helix
MRKPPFASCSLSDGFSDGQAGAFQGENCLAEKRSFSGQEAPMAKGRRTAVKVTLTEDELTTLKIWQRALTLPIGQVRRGRAILLVSAGWPISDVARQVGISRRYVYKWVARFQAQGIEGFRPRIPGRKRGRRPSAQKEEAGGSYGGLVLLAPVGEPGS